MEWKEKERLIAALCACPSLIDEERRGAIFFELPQAVRDGAPRGGTLRAVVAGLVNTCLSHPGGMEDFLRVLRFYEQGSLPMQAVEAAWAEAHQNRNDRERNIEAAKSAPHPPIQAVKAATPRSAAQKKRATAMKRKARTDLAVGAAGLAVGLLAALAISQPLRCALSSLSETGLAFLSLLLAGVTAGINALPGPRSTARARLAGGGFAGGLLLFALYAFIWPVDPITCAVVPQPSTQTASPTLTGTPQPSLTAAASSSATAATTAPATPAAASATSTTRPPAQESATPRPTRTTAAPSPSPSVTYTKTAVFTPTSTPVMTQIAPVDGMVQVYIPRGPFTLGAGTGDPRAAPAQTLFLQAFWIDRTEVTNAQYARCVEARACRPPAFGYSSTRSSYYDNLTYAQYPVVFVTWSQAAQYCSWAGRRLPSEAEWEKAARGTDGRFYPWGEESVPSSIDCERAAVKGCAADTQPAGSFPGGASPAGVLDLAGNVAEWTATRYLPYPYDPTDGREDTLVKGKDILRVIRGGSWASSPLESSAFYRSAIFADPDQAFTPSNSSSLVGFRCAGD